ncbi:MAG TPA: type II secretion system protein GspC [Anaeromyxobacteraceae bacterium]|nr:type II secretion system protein GspC [Anaeromyxobacteraceae bacterium]
MLDLFFRKYAWTAKLALLFAAAWLAAKTVNTAVGAVIRPTPRIDLSALPAGAARAQMWTQLEVDRLYPLIGQKPPAVASADDASGATPPPPPRTCGDRLAPPMKSGLRALLVAGVIAEEPRWSIASITDLATRDTRIYGIGDPVLGAALLSVERIRDERDATGRGFKVVAILCNGGQKEYVDFEPGEGATLASAPGAPSLGVYNPTGPAPPPGPAVEGVRQLGDNRYDVPHRLIESTLSNLNSIATQARIVPSFKNGVANGFKLFSIQPGSLYAAIGVENGDVIQKINGYEINSPDKALEVYQKLRDSRHITIEVERGGQTIRKEYNVTGQ